MPNQHDGKLKKLLLELAGRPNGVSSSELVAYGYTKAQAGGGLNHLVSDGLAFSARLSHKSARYFTDKERAAAATKYDPVTSPKKADRKKAKAAPIDGVKTQFGFAPEAWANAEPVIPEGVKIQRAVTPPPRFVSVPLLTDHKPVERSGAFDYKKHQKPGRY